MKKDKKGGESKDVAQKQKEANEKFKEGEKIMAKEYKTPNDLEKAAQCFTEAISYLSNAN